MSKFIVTLVSVLVLPCFGEQGRIDLHQHMMPITIDEPGSYLFVENLEFGKPMIPMGGMWRYLDDGSNQGTNAWTSIGFDDSLWLEGVARFGYGGDGEVTTNSFGPNPANKHTTYYYRYVFEYQNAAALVDLDMFFSRDDGVVVYLNGTEVVRDNMPLGVIDFSTFATSAIPEGAAEEAFSEYDVDHTLIEEGLNVVAVEIHQINTTSSDLGFDLELFGDIISGKTNGITIVASDVNLNLNGFSLVGGFEDSPSLDGIHVDSLAQNVVVENGVVSDWGEDGVDAGVATLTATGCVFRNIQVSDNFKEGLVAGRWATVDNCISTGNGQVFRDGSHEVGSGVVAGQGSLVRQCISSGNWGHGILVRSSSEIVDSIVYDNDHDGHKGGSGSVFRRCVVARENFNGDGLEVDGASVVANCVSYSNRDDGMKTRNNGHSLFSGCVSGGNYKDGINTRFNGGLIINCSLGENDDDGISTTQSATLYRNLCYGNGLSSGDGGGVNIKDPGNSDYNRIEGNHIVGNFHGVRAVNAGADLNLIVNNSATSNSDDYNVVSGNKVGTITGDPATADEWDNFEY